MGRLVSLDRERAIQRRATELWSVETEGDDASNR
jgi:hypothetical protein